MFTLIVNVAVALPPVLVAVTVYVAEEDNAVGVPEIVPVDVEKASPVGRDGVIAHVTTAPPLEVGVAADIAWSLVKVSELGL